MRTSIIADCRLQTADSRIAECRLPIHGLPIGDDLPIAD